LPDLVSICAGGESCSAGSDQLSGRNYQAGCRHLVHVSYGTSPSLGRFEPKRRLWLRLGAPARVGRFL